MGTVTSVPCEFVVGSVGVPAGTLVTVPIFRAMSGRFALLFELFGLIIRRQGVDDGLELAFHH
jgi:hypothetical protein